MDSLFQVGPDHVDEFFGPVPTLSGAGGIHHVITNVILQVLIRQATQIGFFSACALVKEASLSMCLIEACLDLGNSHSEASVQS